MDAVETRDKLDEHVGDATGVGPVAEGGVNEDLVDFTRREAERRGRLLAEEAAAEPIFCTARNNEATGVDGGGPGQDPSTPWPHTLQPALHCEAE